MTKTSTRYSPEVRDRVYVAFVIDAFARRIVGWRVSRSMQAGFVLEGLSEISCVGHGLNIVTERS